MKLALLISFLTIVASCTPTAPVDGETTSGSVKSANAPYVWPSNAFPRDLKISSAFAPEEEANIKAMSTAWETALENKKNFFDHSAPATEVDKANLNLNSLNDSVMGVYKIQHWPMDLPSSALAVTQIFGTRYNQGDADEYVKMVHADILVNYNLYNFRTDAYVRSTYDLQTTIVHEMGHFLGLSHQPYGADSIMVPSIGTTTERRAPTSNDSNDIAERYNIALSTGGGGSSQKLMKKSFQPKLGDTGTEMRMLIELYPNGECIHRENGVVVQRHSVK